MLPVPLKFFPVVAIISLFAQGCSGNKDNDPRRGVFLDSPVGGLKYLTATRSGFTADDGGFYYEEGESIVFSIGDLMFPSVTAQSIITPLDIAQSDDIENEKTINLLRLLQSMDVDQNPRNGITIPQSAHEKVKTSQIAFDGSFDAEVFISTIVSLAYTAERLLVDEDTAVNHFVNTLSREVQGEAIDVENYPLTFLVARDDVYRGDFLSVQNGQYALNLNGNWESGVSGQNYSVMRLKSSSGQNRFVTSGTSDNQLFFCINSRPTAIRACEGRELFAVFADQAAAHSFSWASVIFPGEELAGEPSVGAAQETSREQEAGGAETDGGTGSLSTPANSGDENPDQSVIRTTTDCPLSATAPAQLTVTVSEPAGCAWAAFESSPWTWSPAASYDVFTNTLTVSGAGTYTGEFEHTCVHQDSGETLMVRASCSVSVEAAPGPQDITDLFFVTGQTNASGVETRYDPTIDLADNRIFAFTDSGWQVADLHQNWERSIPGNYSGEDITRSPYNHIGFQLTREIAEQSDRVVGLVVLTAPGEGISHWDYNSEFFIEMRVKATAALNELPHKSQFDAMIWMQGETDWLFEGTADPGATGFSAGSDDYRNYYPNKLFQLISNFRSENWFRFDGRFICAETKKAPLNPHLMALNTDDDPYSGCAEASDLPTRVTDPYGNHFSADSFRLLGRRLANVYLSMDE